MPDLESPAQPPNIFQLNFIASIQTQDTGITSSLALNRTNAPSSPGLSILNVRCSQAKVFHITTYLRILYVGPMKRFCRLLARSTLGNLPHFQLNSVAYFLAFSPSDW